jgi:hypothetical protein
MVWAVIIKGKISDIEYLRDLAFAASRNAPRDQWDYWEEKRAEGLAFCFQWSGAARAFTANCLLRGIKVQTDPEWSFL